MNIIFKSALNQIKAEKTLVHQTEAYLKDQVNNKPKLVNFFKNVKTMNKAIAAACFLVILAGGSSVAYGFYKTPVAYLSLDINPSVELGVNTFGTVVTAEGYNEDGVAIMEGIDLIGSTVESAVEKLIISADEKGYIAEDGSTVISLTSETANTDKATTLQTSSESGVTQALEGVKKEAVVQKDNVALERRDEARELGITPGKLNLIEKLLVVDPTASIEEYKDASVKEIMKTIKLNKANSKSDSDDVKEEATENTTIDATIDAKTDTNIDASIIEETKKINENKSANANNKESNTSINNDSTTSDLDTKDTIPDTSGSSFKEDSNLENDGNASENKIKSNAPDNTNNSQNNSKKTTTDK